MTQLKFHRDGWLEGNIGDADERATFTRLKITAANSIITRAFSERGGGETDAINVPIFPLASYIARLWWPLLYEPIRARTDRTFAGRHRLDLPMHGYVFPSLGLCSAGDDAVLVDWALLENEHSPLKFLTPAPKEPVQVSRDDIEPELMNVVESALERLRTQSNAHVELRDNWNQVKETLASPEQLGYCMAAGRLEMCIRDSNTMSAHLAVLSRAGLVRGERHSRSIIYRAELTRLREVMLFLVKDCCGGNAELCAPLIAELTEPCCPPKAITSKRSAKA